MTLGTSSPITATCSRRSSPSRSTSSTTIFAPRAELIVRATTADVESAGLLNPLEQGCRHRVESSMQAGAKEQLHDGAQPSAELKTRGVTSPPVPKRRDGLHPQAAQGTEGHRLHRIAELLARRVALYPLPLPQ